MYGKEYKNVVWDSSLPEIAGASHVSFFLHKDYPGESLDDVFWLCSLGLRLPSLDLSTFFAPPPSRKAESASEVVNHLSPGRESLESRGDSICHLVQDREVVDEMLAKELPPEKYYKEL